MRDKVACTILHSKQASGELNSGQDRTAIRPLNSLYCSLIKIGITISTVQLSNLEQPRAISDMCTGTTDVHCRSWCYVGLGDLNSGPHNFTASAFTH